MWGGPLPALGVQEIEPALGAVSPASMRRRVDLPDPFGPSITITSPLRAPQDYPPRGDRRAVLTRRQVPEWLPIVTSACGDITGGWRGNSSSMLVMASRTIAAAAAVNGRLRVNVRCSARSRSSIWRTSA